MLEKKAAGQEQVCPVCDKPLVYAPENLVDRRSYFYCSCCEWFREIEGKEKELLSAAEYEAFKNYCL